MDVHTYNGDGDKDEDAKTANESVSKESCYTIFKKPTTYLLIIIEQSQFVALHI